MAEWKYQTNRAAEIPPPHGKITMHGVVEVVSVDGRLVTLQFRSRHGTAPPATLQQGELLEIAITAALARQEGVA